MVGEERRGELQRMIEPIEIRTQDLPFDVQIEFIKEAEVMIDELKTNWLEVVLIPAPEPMHEGHMIRAVANKNPEWYRKYFGGFHQSKNDCMDWYGSRSNIRKRVVSALEYIIDSDDRFMRPINNMYRLHGIVRAIIAERFVNGYYGCTGIAIQPNATFMEYHNGL